MERVVHEDADEKHFHDAQEIVDAKPNLLVFTTKMSTNGLIHNRISGNKEKLVNVRGNLDA